MDNCNMLDQTNQEDQRDEINYYSPRNKSHLTVIQTIGFCPMCNKRLTNADAIYSYEAGDFCSDECGIQFIEEESA